MCYAECVKLKVKRNSTVKRIYRTLRLPFEWFAIWLGETIIPPLSMAGALRLSRFIADTVFFFDGTGKAVSFANLRTMFPLLSARRQRILAHGAYRNMARVLVMIFWFGCRDTRARIKRWVTFGPSVLAALNAHRPCVTVSAHVGNWEILSQSCVAAGMPMTSVAKQVGTEGITKRLTRIRSCIGQEILPAEGALRGLVHALKSGRYIGLLVDQHTHVWQGGAWVDFFGIAAGVSLAPAALALKFKVPILFAWSRPLRDGGYRIEPGGLFLPEGQTQQQLAQTMVSAFERVIRRHPSLWCLNYRRWRYIKNGSPHPERYPYYARPEKMR